MFVRQFFSRDHRYRYKVYRYLLRKSGIVYLYFSLRRFAYSHRSFRLAVKFCRTFIRGFLLRPDALVLELSSACNAKCIMCSRGRLRARDDDMDFKLVSKLVDEARTLGIKKFQLSFYGEPLMSANLVDAVRLIKDQIPDAYVMISTNGALLTRDKLESLAEAGMDLFKISIEGYERETYERVRNGLSWDVLLQNMSNIREVSSSGKYDFRHMIWGLKLKIVDYDPEAYVEFWRKYADQVVVRNEHRLKKQSFIEKILPCDRPFNYLVVLSNGRVSPCLNDWYAKYAFGNLKKDSIAGVWRSAEFLKYRLLNILGMKKLLSICRDCSYCPMQPPVART